MPRLYNKDSGSYIGPISDEDLAVLVDQLEETDQKDDDYFIDAPTIDLLRELGASSQLVSMLTAAVGSTDGMEVRVEK